MNDMLWSDIQWSDMLESHMLWSVSVRCTLRANERLMSE